MRDLSFATALLLTALLALTSPTDGRCQGIFLPKRSSGLGVQGSFSANENAVGAGTAIGYSVKGMVDLGLLFERVDFQQPILDSDFTAIGVGPSLTVHLAKTNQISLAATASYERANFLGEINFSDSKSVHSNIIAAGISLYHSKPSSRSVKLIPVLGLNFVSTEFVRTSDSGYADNTFDETFVGSFGLNFTIKHKAHNTLFVNPTTFVSDGNFGFVLSVGYVLLTSG